jgi:hypothetical protein
MTSATCEQCRTTEGTPYEFHYGRSAPVPDRTDRFQIGGVETVTLCPRCLTRARVRRAARVVARDWVREPLVLLGYFALAVALGVWAWQGDWSSFIVGTALALAVTALVFVVTYVVLHDEDFAQHLAVELHQEKLRNEGWDSFWTDNELKLLSPH